MSRQAGGYYQSGQARAAQVQRLFTRIARKYDLINDLQSLGLHRLWKRRLIHGIAEAIPPRNTNPIRVLDLACGSGDLMFRVRERFPQAGVIGGDYTFSMLQVAAERWNAGKKLAGNSDSSGSPGLVQLDGLGLPFAEHTFDAAVMGYGLRNMSDFLTALQELFRVLKPGGRVAILEFAKPPNPLFRRLYHGVLKTIQPVLGWIFFRDANTYRYILESLDHYPSPQGVTKLMAQAGFKDVTCESLALGGMTIHRGRT
jgi:demethylmenaquinone methyltransferase / 2-methoxy-6-polyprenyl-1,4-benzoquinol methylase